MSWRRGITLALLLAVAAGTAACGVVSGTRPAPTPADFLGISSAFVTRGITVGHVVAGDPGCEDRTLSATAIRFDASGIDQSAPVTVYLYIFGDRDAYQKLRAAVDACARAYVTDPDTFVSIDAPPFVVVSQGPWGPAFRAAIRDGLTQAAGG